MTGTAIGRRRRFRLAALVAAVAAPGLAQAGAIAMDDPRLATTTTLTVSVPNVAPGGPYPANYTADGRDISPPVSWTQGPPGTRSYVLVMQDPDAPAPEAAVHWLLYNIPAATTALPRYLRNEATPSKPLGAAQGPNFHGSLGYSGPRPPPGGPPHHYHLQVFALDRPLRAPPGAALPVVERAMAGHVIARGDLAATYATRDPNAPSKSKDAGVQPPQP